MSMSPVFRHATVLAAATMLAITGSAQAFAGAPAPIDVGSVYTAVKASQAAQSVVVTFGAPAGAPVATDSAPAITVPATQYACAGDWTIGGEPFPAGPLGTLSPGYNAVDWLTVTPTSGHGSPFTVTFTYAANPSNQTRSAVFDFTCDGVRSTTVTPAKAFLATQDATPSLSVTPAAVTVPADGGPVALNVTGTSWKVAGNPDWLAIAASPTWGMTTANYTAAANTGPARSATLTFTTTSGSGSTEGQLTQAVTVAQAAAPTAATAAAGTGAATQGAKATVTGTGFLPGENVTATMYSDPYTIGTQQADPNGAVTFTWTVPSSTPAGAHTVQLVGADSGTTASAPLTVQAAPVAGVTYSLLPDFSWPAQTITIDLARPSGVQPPLPFDGKCPALWNGHDTWIDGATVTSTPDGNGQYNLTLIVQLPENTRADTVYFVTSWSSILCNGALPPGITAADMLLFTQAPVPAMTLSPTTWTAPASGGTQTFQLQTTTGYATSGRPTWLVWAYDSTARGYVATAAPNTGAARSATITFRTVSQGASITEATATLKVTQAAAAGAATATAGTGSTTQGGQATITGTGFLPGEDVTATLYSDPVVIGTQPADPNGDVTFTWTVPPTTPAGDHTVQLVGADSGTTTAAPLTVQAAAAAPTIQLVRQDAQIRGNILVQGQGFQPNENVTVTLTPGNRTLGSAPADNGGNLFYMFTVPQDLAAGSYSVTAQGSSSGLSASALLLIQGAWSPGCAPGIYANLDGGWQKVTSITIPKDGQEIVPWSIAGLIVVPAAGTGAGMMPQPTEYAGVSSYKWIRTPADSPGSSAEANTGCTAAYSPRLIATANTGANRSLILHFGSGGPALTIYQLGTGSTATMAAASVTAGGSAGVTGTGFLPGEDVTATMHSDPVVIGTQPADENGDVSFTWTVPPTTDPGNHTVDLVGATSAASATATLAVAAVAPGDPLDAQLVSVSVNGTAYNAAGAPISVAADHVFTVDIAMKNTGTLTWGADRGAGQHGYTLLTRNPDYNATFGTRLIAGGGGGAPGTTATYHSGLRAPSTPGDYTLTLQPADWWPNEMSYGGLSYDGAAFFGDQVILHVTVTAPTPAPVVQPVPAGVVSVADFEYQGSFALPAVPGAAYGDTKYYTESGIALRTVGGEQRLLALTGTYDQALYEVAIPDQLGKITGADTSVVPTATLRTNFGGLPVTSLLSNGTIWYDQSSGLLYWSSYYNGYGSSTGQLVLRAANLDAGTLDQVQQWTQPAPVGTVSPAWFSYGVTGIPAGFATAYTGGKTLAMGFASPYGTSLAAVSAPSSGGDVTYLPIMYTASDARTVRDGNYFVTSPYDVQPTDPWTGWWTYSAPVRAGVFIDLPDKKGYLTFAHQPTNRVSSDGFDSGSQNVWYVYDYATLGAAAAGGAASLAPAPSNYATVALPGSGTPNQQYVTGAVFDPTTRLLYVYVRGALSGEQPLVDVYKVRESATSGLSGVPTTATAGVPLTLTASGTTAGQTVTWSVSPTDDGSTGAAVTGSTLTTLRAGTATVRASVYEGTALITTQDFPITVNPASYADKQITRFTVNGVDGVINQATHQIWVTLPPGYVYLGSMTPTIEFTGVSVTPASGTAQNFAGGYGSSGVVTYTVTARDGTTQPYQVVVGTDDARISVSLSGPYSGVGQNTVTPGATGTMGFSALNYGLAPADDVALVLTLPDGITPGDLSVSYTGVPSTYDTATGWWRIPHLDAATLHNGVLNGGGARLDIIFAVPSDAKNGAHYVFTGQLINVNGQPLVPGQVGYSGPSSADFLVVAADQAWPLPQIDTANWNTPGGNTHQYDAVLRVFGTGDLTGVTASVPVPDGYTLVSATPTVGTYDVATGVWTLGSFTPDGIVAHYPRLTMVIAAAGTPPASTALSLQISTVYGVAPDPALGTTAYMGLSVTPALSLTARADKTTAAPGDTVVHTLTFGTNTPAGVYGAKVAVTLPAHVTLVSAVSPGGGTFDAATGTWTAAPLGSGVTSTLTLTYTVDADAPNATPITTAAIAAAIPTLGFPNPASALVTTTAVAPNPAPVTLAVVGTETNVHTVVLTWTAPYDNGATNSGRAASYDVRYSTTPITAATFDTSRKADMTIAPQPAGDTERLYVNALDTGTTYYFALRTTSTTGLVSAMSNVVSATTGPQPGAVDEVTVSGKDELQAAIDSAPPQGRIITVAAGEYEQPNTIIIQNHNNITIQGATSNPADTVFYGQGMNGQLIHNVYINASSYVTIKNLTLRDSYYHGIQVNNGSQYFHADNLVVWDNGESAFKITAGEWGVEGTPQYSDYGLIENCHFGFTANGVRSVIEGIDGVAVKGWVARNNVAENVRDISGGNYGYAMYFKGNSIDSDFIANTVINSDIGISFGDGSSGYTYYRYGDTRFEEQGGIMANNVVKSTSKDTGIVLRGATDFKVYNNTVWNTDAYPSNSISLRVSDTTVPAGYATPQPTQYGEIINNIFRFAIEPDYGSTTNQLATTILMADNLAGGQSVATGLDPALFVDAANGDFHLASTATAAIGQGANLIADVPVDADGVARPATGAFDIGAYQYVSSAPAELTALTIAGGSLVRPAAFDGRRTVYWVKPTAAGGGTLTVTATAPVGASLTYTLDGAAHTGSTFALNLGPSKLMSEIGITVSTGGQSTTYYLDVAAQDPTSYAVAQQYYDLKPYNPTTDQTRVLVDQFNAGETHSANQLDFIATYLEGSQKNTSDITGPVLAQNPGWHSLHYHLAIWNNPNASIIWNDQWTDAETAQLAALAQTDPNVFMYAVDKRTGTNSVIRDVSADRTYLMNITNDTYYNWLLANIIDQCQTDNYDSVFLDSYNMDTVYAFTGGNYVNYDGTAMMTYQDPQLGGLTWAQASEEFMARLTHDLNAAGIWSLPNLGNQRTTWDPIDYAYSNGGMFEQAPETPTAARGDWQQDMSRYIYLAEKGKVLIYQNYSVSSIDDVATRLYVTAAYQMGRADYTYVNQMVADQSMASWYPEYEIGARLGAPTQTVTGVPDTFVQSTVDPLIGQYAIGSSLYERTFTNGLVVINADSSGTSHTFTVPNDGTSYVSLTIRPGSGGSVPPSGGIDALRSAPNYPLIETPVSAGQVITLPGDGAVILVAATTEPDPSAKQITSFTVNGVAGTINETNHTIVVPLPVGTDLHALAPVVTYKGASISPASGVAMDLSYLRTYTVTATDGSTQVYLVRAAEDRPSLGMSAGASNGEGETTPGASGYYMTGVGNYGLKTADDVILSIPFPAGLDPATTTITTSQGTYDPATGLWHVGTLHGVTDAINMFGGGSATISFSFTIPATATTGDRYHFGPQLQDSAGQPIAEAPGYRFIPADFIVVLPGESWVDPAVFIGYTVPYSWPDSYYHYALTLTPLGTGPLTDVTVTHQIPAGLVLMDATPNVGTYDAATGVWTIPAIDPSVKPNLQLAVAPEPTTPTSTVTAVMTVTQINGTAPATPPTATATLQILGPDALSLTAAADTTTAAPGDTVTHTITLTNTTDVQVVASLKVTLPAHATLTKAVPDLYGSFDPDTGLWNTYVCSPWSPCTLTLTYTVDPGTPDGTALTTTATWWAAPFAAVLPPAPASATTTVTGVPTPTLSFASDSLVKPYGAAPFTNALTNTGTGAVTYSSSDPTVATVNAATGEVTVHNLGATTITANAAAVPGTWAAATAAYTLTVNPAACSGVAGSWTSNDTLVPWSGNGGYDALHYDINLAYTPAAGSEPYRIDATTTIDATATVPSLCSFSLDLLGLTVTDVTVDGVPALFAPFQDAATNTYKLVVTPATPISGDFTVAVAYGGIPQQFTFHGAYDFAVGWMPDTSFYLGSTLYPADGGGVGLGEPVGAFAWYPVNAVPSDKASYTTTLTVPTGWQGVGIGDLVSTTAISPTQDTWVWNEPDDVPSSFTIAAIGSYAAYTDTHTTPGGTTVPLEIYADPNIASAASNPAHYLELTKALLDWGEANFGPYQPAVAGYVMKRIAVSYALEVYGKPFYTADWGDQVYVHEFAHQWAGNSVSVADWSDLWLAEGFATYAEWLWNEDQGTATVTDQALAVYNLPDTNSLWTVAPAAMRDQGDMFGNWNYDGGGLALAALREGIGPDLMQQVLLTWFDMYAGGNASTTDFIALAESITGADLTQWANDYLYSYGKPPVWPAPLSYLPPTPQPQELSFASPLVTKTYGEAAFTNPLTQVGDGTVSYATGNPAVATVDSAGLVTITGAGSTTITATAAAVPDHWLEATASYTLTVDQRAVAGATVTAGTQTYTGSPLTPAPVVTLGGTTLTPVTDYTVAYFDNTNAGTATITVTGVGNYTGTATGTFTITPRAITLAVDPIPDQVETGSALTPAVTVRDGTAVLTLTRDYTVSYANNTAPGTATVTITGAGNYAGSTGTATFAITAVSQPLPQTLTFDATAVTKVTTDPPFTNHLTHVGDGTLTFTSGNTAVATVNATTGEVTIVGTGSTTISVAAAAVTNQWLAATGSYALTVTAAPVAQPQVITFDTPAVRITLGDTFTNVIHQTGTGAITWTSSDETVATVNPTTGAVAVLGAGTTTITAHAAAVPGLWLAGTGSYTLTVDPPPAEPQVLTFDSPTVTITYGATFTNQLHRTGTGTLTWASSDPAVATVDAATGTVTVRGVGTTTITVTAAAVPGVWLEGAGSYDLVVNAISLTGATVTAAGATYTGAAQTPAPTVTLNGTTVPPSTYTTTYANNTNAGTATVTVTGTGVYAGTATGTFTIAPKAITFALDPIADQTVTGSPITPAAVVRDGTAVVPTSAYTLSYANNTAVGTATVTATGLGNYAGSTGTRTFQITTAVQPDQPQDLRFASATVTKAYGDAPFTNPLTRTGTGALTFTSTNTAVATVDSAGLVTIHAPGTTSITVVAAAVPGAWLAASASYDLTVTPRDLSGATIGVTGGSVYTGAPLTPAVSVTLGGTLTPGVDYALAYSNNTNAGTATVTVTGLGKYAGTASRTFTIAPKQVTFAVAPVADQAFTGSAVTPALQVRDGTTLLAEGTAYTVAYSNNVNPGTATATVSGIGNYLGSTGTVTFVITAPPTPQPQSVTFDQSAVSVELGASVTNAVHQVGTGALTWTSSVPAVATVDTTGHVTVLAVGQTVITASAAAVAGEWLAGTGSYTLTVTQPVQSQTLTWAHPAVTVTYGQPVVNALSHTGAGAVTYSSADTTVATVDASGVVTTRGTGQTTILATAAAVPGLWWSATASYDLTVTPAMLGGATVQVTAGPTTYTGSPVQPSVTVTAGGTTLTPGTDYTVTYSNNTAAGTATITVTGIGHYAGTASTQFTIAPRTGAFAIDPIPDQTATGSALAPAVTVRDGTRVLQQGTDYTVAYSNNTAAGTGTVTITGIGNYAGTATAQFTIAAPVPALVVNPTTWSATAGADTTTVTVDTNQATWSAASDQPWLTALRVGNVVTLVTAPNPSTAARTAVVTVTAGTLQATVAVTQAGGTMSIGTPPGHFDTAGGTAQVPITSTTGLGWLVAGLPSWVSVSSWNGAAGTPLSLTVAPYTGGAWNVRTATLTVTVPGSDPAHPVQTQVTVSQHNWPGGDVVVLHDGTLVTAVQPGWTLTGIAAGFTPGDIVHGWMYSLPLDLGTTVANAGGVASFTWVVPADTPAGDHRFEAVGTGLTQTVHFTIPSSAPQSIPTGGSVGGTAEGVIVLAAVTTTLPLRRRGTR